MVKSCLIAEWSGIQMVVWAPDYHLNNEHLNTKQVKVNYSDVSATQILTVASCTVVSLKMIGYLIPSISGRHKPPKSKRLIHSVFSCFQWNDTNWKCYDFCVYLLALVFWMVLWTTLTKSRNLEEKYLRIHWGSEYKTVHFKLGLEYQMLYICCNNFWSFHFAVT